MMRLGGWGVGGWALRFGVSVSVVVLHLAVQDIDLILQYAQLLLHLRSALLARLYKVHVSEANCYSFSLWQRQVHVLVTLVLHNLVKLDKLRDLDACHASHVTRHTSHVTRHTSHVTRTTPHAVPPAAVALQRAC